MDTKETLLSELCDDLQFTDKAFLKAERLSLRPEVRQMCASNSCQSYGTNWICPPACGSLEEIKRKTAKFSMALVVQNVYTLDDIFDYENMMAGQEKHQKKFERLVKAIRLQSIPIFPMGAGGCMKCKQCTYPDAPCLFPDLVFPSMEACGLLVGDICEEAGLQYYYGSGTVAYTSLILF